MPTQPNCSHICCTVRTGIRWQYLRGVLKRKMQQRHEMCFRGTYKPFRSRLFSAPQNIRDHAACSRHHTQSQLAEHRLALTARVILEALLKRHAKRDCHFERGHNQRTGIGFACRARCDDGLHGSRQHEPGADRFARVHRPGHQRHAHGAGDRRLRGSGQPVHSGGDTIRSGQCARDDAGPFRPAPARAASTGRSAFPTTISISSRQARR